MKMLNEVIKAFECCDHGEPDSRCEDCPYNGIGACCLERENDALFYLKDYRWVQENCADALAEKYPSENPPLTWNELKAMTGKPIWVEMDDIKFWTVVDNFRTICNQECLCCSKGYMCRSTYVRGDWQAYRKEKRMK